MANILTYPCYGRTYPYPTRLRRSKAAPIHILSISIHAMIKRRRIKCASVALRPHAHWHLSSAPLSARGRASARGCTGAAGRPSPAAHGSSQAATLNRERGGGGRGGRSRFTCRGQNISRWREGERDLSPSMKESSDGGKGEGSRGAAFYEGLLSLRESSPSG